MLAFIVEPQSALATSNGKLDECEKHIVKNSIPPRLQWDQNFGYCGEVSFISAGLYYGQYISQYTARAIASKNKPQNHAKSQLMLGINDLDVANRMHLNAIAWRPGNGQTRDFLRWVKTNVLEGNPVAIGVFANENLLYENRQSEESDSEFDHIVSVFGIGSNKALNHLDYDDDDIIYLSDHGLWSNTCNPPYIFRYPFGAFQGTREDANDPKSSMYTLPNNGNNYGIAITGVKDLNGETLPVRIETSVNFEEPEIEDGSEEAPLPMPLRLTITVSDLKPHVLYFLYKYDDFAKVPDSKFNANASKACKKWEIKLYSGTTFITTEEIQSDEIAVYRVVPATAG